jgi:hypothetical protein
LTYFNNNNYYYFVKRIFQNFGFEKTILNWGKGGFLDRFCQATFKTNRVLALAQGF